MRAAALPQHRGASTVEGPSSFRACDDPDLVSARGSTPARAAKHRFPLGAAAWPDCPVPLRRNNKSGASRFPEAAAASTTRRAADCAVALRRRGTCCRRTACSLRRRFRATSRRPAYNFRNSSSSACIAPDTNNRSTVQSRTRPNLAAPLARYLSSECNGRGHLTVKNQGPPSVTDSGCSCRYVWFFSIHICRASRSARVPICALAHVRLLMRKASCTRCTQTPLRSR